MLRISLRQQESSPLTSGGGGGRVPSKKKQQSKFPWPFSRSARKQKPRTIPFNADGSKRSRSVINVLRLTTCVIDKQKKYAPNIIVNQKYNVFTFIPLVLYEQVYMKRRLYISDRMGLCNGYLYA